MSFHGSFGGPPEHYLALPSEKEPVFAILVLTGSSGEVAVQHAQHLAKLGAAALAVRWFGDECPTPGICEVPLEIFDEHINRLASLSQKIGIIASSKATEAALLLASSGSPVSAVAAISPSSVVWANVGPGRDGRERPMRSSWTRQGSPLSFVPYDQTWQEERETDGPAFRTMYEQSLRTFPAAAAAARIPVERFSGNLLLTAGRLDRVWPSDFFAQQIKEARSRAGLQTQVVTSDSAGHRIRFPHESPRNAGIYMARGGTPQHDRDLGSEAWPLLKLLFDLG